MACSGWTTHFRQYVFVPGNSELFETFRRGTAEEVLQLFRQRRTYPFSVEEETGVTVLHVSPLIHYAQEINISLLRYMSTYGTEPVTNFEASTQQPLSRPSLSL